MKKLLSLILSLTMILGVLSAAAPAFAANVTINATEIELYTLSDTYKEAISIPSGLNETFQLAVKNASSVKYSVKSGRTATVSANGLVEPRVTTYYWYGNIGYSMPLSGKEPTRVTKSYDYGESVISVKADSVTFNVTVDVKDYAVEYSDNIIDEFIKTDIKSSMTDYQKIVEIAKFVSSFSYSASYSSYVSLLTLGKGDCWAFSSAVVEAASRAGLNAWLRNANKDPGAGSGHRNAMVETSDGTYYQVETSYGDGDYDITKRSSLFSYRTKSGGIEVYQYDGKTFPATLNVPETIDGKKVVSIAAQSFGAKSALEKVVLPATVKSIGEYAFASCEKLSSINLPKALETISAGAFYSCPKISFTCSSPNFCVQSGVVYNANKTVLVCAPTVSVLNVPYGVETIETYACYNNKSLTSVTIPATVTKIGDIAFACCSGMNSLKISGNNLTEIGKYAFAECSSLKSINLPSSVKTLGDDILRLDKSIEVFTESEAVKDYCQTNSISLNEHHPGSEVKENIVASTCVKKGSYDKVVYCSVCSEEISRSTVTLELAEHTIVTDKAVPATCTEAGLTEGKHCSVCNKVFTAQQVVMPNDHSWDSGKITTMPSYSSTGVKTYTCANCGDTYEETIPVLKGKINVTNANPSYGTARVSKDSANSGELITVTAAPKTGYHLSEITVKTTNGKGITVDKNGNFIMPAGNVNVTVKFAADVFTVTYVAYDNSVISTEQVEYGCKPQSIPEEKIICNGDATHTVISWKENPDTVIKSDRTFTQLATTQACDIHEHLVNPSCTEKGYTEQTCPECGYSVKTDYTNVLPHSFKSNNEEQYCRDCGAVNPDYKPLTVNKTTIKKLKKGKKKFTVKWAKVKDADGYVIQYSLKKNMKSAKKKTVKGSAKTSLTVKKLKSKKYYVRVRAYKVVNGKRVYGKWSAKKAVKVK